MGADGLAAKIAQAAVRANTQTAPPPIDAKYGVSNGYAGVENFPGLVEKGNIDLTKRRILDNPDGSYGSEYSMSFNDGKHEVLVPTIFENPDGSVSKHSSREAIKRYADTGEHMGKFASGNYNGANAYSEIVHSRVIKVDGVVYQGKGKASKVKLQGYANKGE